jgi:hypothetical protein
MDPAATWFRIAREGGAASPVTLSFAGLVFPTTLPTDGFFMEVLNTSITSTSLEVLLFSPTPIDPQGLVSTPTPAGGGLLTVVWDSGGNNFCFGNGCSF